jgi:hypothetical protein
VFAPQHTQFGPVDVLARARTIAERTAAVHDPPIIVRLGAVATSAKRLFFRKRFAQAHFDAFMTVVPLSAKFTCIWPHAFDAITARRI